MVESFDRSVFSTILALTGSMITLWNANKESHSKRAMMWSSMILFIMAFCSYIYSTDWCIMVKSFLATALVSAPLLYLIYKTDNEEKRYANAKD